VITNPDFGRRPNTGKQGIGILKIARTVGAGTSYVQRIVAEIEAAAS
jgi:hypothetical protein